jgi:hypothetical protein
MLVWDPAHQTDFALVDVACHRTLESKEPSPLYPGLERSDRQSFDIAKHNSLTEMQTKSCVKARQTVCFKYVHDRFNCPRRLQERNSFRCGNGIFELASNLEGQSDEVDVCSGKLDLDKLKGCVRV